MFSKKAQSEIITTVLIILLVLAAVVIVWQVVQNTVSKGGEAVTAGTACIGLSLTVDSAAEGTGAGANIVTVKYTRGSDSLGALASVKMLVVDKTTGTTVQSADYSAATEIAGALEQKTIVTAAIAAPGLTTGTEYQVRLAPKVGSSQCDVSGTKDFTAVA